MITSNILQTATTPNRYSNMPWKKIVREHGIIEITPQDWVLRDRGTRKDIIDKGDEADRKSVV